MKLTIHRGSHEIGGNCVEITTDSTRIVLDVGKPLFDANRMPFDDTVLRDKSIGDLLEAKILPNVPGLFTEGPTPDAILLSHAHMWDRREFRRRFQREVDPHGVFAIG
jgi:ribonuclease J